MARVRLNVADIEMAVEMFAASPDGKAEKERNESLLASLPDAHMTISGYWVCCTTGMCGTCYECVEANDS